MQDAEHAFFSTAPLSSLGETTKMEKRTSAAEKKKAAIAAAASKSKSFSKSKSLSLSK